MYVLVLRCQLHVPEARSLKQKRSVVRSVVKKLDGWVGVAAAEVDDHDTWHVATVGISIVGGSVNHVEHTAERVERLLWSQPNASVIDLERSWWENDNG